MSLKGTNSPLNKSVFFRDKCSKAEFAFHSLTNFFLTECQFLEIIELSQNRRPFFCCETCTDCCAHVSSSSLQSSFVDELRGAIFINLFSLNCCKHSRNDKRLFRKTLMAYWFDFNYIHKNIKKRRSVGDERLLTKSFDQVYTWLEELLSADFCLTAWQMALATTALPEAVLTSPNANMCSILSSL